MNDKVQLVVKISGRAETVSFDIPVDSSLQFGICPAGTAELRVQLQSIAPLNALGEYPSGYEVCAECFELVVSGGECDPLQFYWDTKSSNLSWWRA